MKPCESCPIVTWANMTNPDVAEHERAIRADEARAWRNTLERAAAQVGRLNQRLVSLEADNARLRVELDQLREKSA